MDAGNKIYWGIKTGYNDAFVIDEKKRAELIATDARSTEIIRPLAVGDDIRKWHVRDKGRYLIFSRRGIDISKYPAVKEHLELYRERLEPRPKSWPAEIPWAGRKPGSYKWYEIQDDVAYFREFDKPKIIFPDIAKESRFVLDTNGMYVNNTTYFISMDDYFLLGVLNSAIMWEYFKRHFTVLGDPEKGGRLRFFSQDVVHIPIPRANENQKNRVAALARRCQSASDGDRLELEKALDDEVALLFGFPASVEAVQF